MNHDFAEKKLLLKEFENFLDANSVYIFLQKQFPFHNEKIHIC